MAKKLVLYPNPFINILNIDNPSLIKLLQVLDHSGKLIKTINAPNSSLQLDDLPSGVYLIILDMNNGSKQSSKVIKK
nr:T9SS type A sorting domain-containing protein [Chryseobacterium balustinum]